MYIIMLIFFVAMFLQHVLCSQSNNFGKFDLKVAKIEQFAGPKRKDCCIWDVVLENNRILHFNITVKDNVKPLKVKINVLANDNEFVRLQLKAVCENIFLKQLFQSIVHLTDDCTILKGRYTFDVDVEETVQKYFGGQFLYGNITFKSVFYNNDCNFSCFRTSVALSPKKI